MTVWVTRNDWSWVFEIHHTQTGSWRRIDFVPHPLLRDLDVASHLAGYYENIRIYRYPETDSIRSLYWRPNG